MITGFFIPHQTGESGQEATSPGSKVLQERNRSKIPDEFKWNLADIYPTVEAWRSKKDELVTLIPSVEGFRGKLSSSASTLLECLELVSRLGKEYTRLYCYASMLSDEDTRVAKYLGMEQEMGQIGSDFAARTAFVEPEILTMDKELIESFITAEPGLEIYRHGLMDILRRKTHTGTEGEERILANAGLISDTPNSIYSIFSNADFPWPEVTLSDGKVVKLDKTAFALHKAAPDREDRQKIFKAYFRKHEEFKRTFGAQLYAEVKKNMFYARSRRYPSSLHRALDGGNIPVEVYYGLIDNVSRHLPTFHRYLALRKRILRVSELHYYDLYAPLVPHVDVQYSIDEAKEIVLASLAPLGKEYIEVTRKCFADRWMDVYPNDGKRSGAYSNGGVYDVHPYILLNYNGKYDDVSTLTHELGHTMHSYLTNATQAYTNSHYSIFVAEVASTFNEALLMDHMLNVITDDSLRLSLLGSYLDGIRGTVFRQTQFAEFELRIHETAERGDALTGDTLSALYDEIAKRYYGHDAGFCIVDDEIAVEWAHIPHFYYNFYVYQYATSYTASAAISERVLAGDGEAVRTYIELLRAGGSDYPIALLQRAGVDMTTPEPFDLTMRKMNRVMDEMEKTLVRMGN